MVRSDNPSPSNSADRAVANSAPKSLETAKSVVVSWLKALGSGDVNQVKSSTAHRFSFRTTSRSKECERDFTGRDGLALFIECLRQHEKLFIGELAKADVFGPLSQDPTTFSPKLRLLLPPMEDDEFVVTETFPTGEQYGFAMSQDNPGLLTAVNEALAAMQEDGTYDEIYAKWFGDG